MYHQAMHVKKKLHDRAVKQKLARPKKFSYIGHYIAPIWRENHIGSSDEDEDDEEARRAKDERKKSRKAAKEKKIAGMVEAQELAHKFRQEKEKNDKPVYVAPKEMRIGKPRESVQYV